MTKSKIAFTELQELHRTGHFEAAKKGYLALLKNNATDPELLHALGVLSAQEGDFSTSADYLQQATEFQQDNPILFLNWGNALKSLGLFSQAAQQFHRAIELDPNYSTALNNLGTVYYSQGKLTEAERYFRQAIDKNPAYTNAYYNLGLALAKQDKQNEAIAIYQQLLHLAPEHAAALFQIGCILLQQNKITAAEKYFLAVEQNHPHHFETQTNLATCYLKLGALKEAKNHYLNALKLMPDDTQILFNLGVINMQQGLIDSAIQYYQRAIQKNPDFFDAHNNLGVTFLAKPHVGYALQHFQEALRLQPNNKAIDYTVQMLAQNQQLLTSPPEYIRNLFDTYADHYDQHLLTALDYKIPELLFQAIQSIIKKSSSLLDILDLGCGTGLCGTLFKPLAKTLIGVDLSPNMLAIAAQKNIYDELITSDVVTYLADNPSAFDLIIAGDVLVYTGDLQPLFKAVSQTLRQNGLFAFNTEITDQADFNMNQSGRFSHHKKYLETLGEQHGLKVVYYKNVITRQQNNEPVHGHLYVLAHTGK